MTVKLTISLPDDLGDFVRSQENASGYVAEAVRTRQRLDATRAALEAVGIQDVPSDEYAQIAAAHAEQMKRAADPGRRAYLDAKLAELTRRDPR